MLEWDRNRRLKYIHPDHANSLPALFSKYYPALQIVILIDWISKLLDKKVFNSVTRILDIK